MKSIQLYVLSIVYASDFILQKLIIEGDIISQTCTINNDGLSMSGTTAEYMTSDQLIAQNIYANEQFHSDIIYVKFLSPLEKSDQDQKETDSELLEINEPTIRLHGTMNFKGGLIRTSDETEIYSKNKKPILIQTEMVQQVDEPQWIHIERAQIGWNVQSNSIINENIVNQSDIAKLKREIQHIDSTLQKHQKGNQIQEEAWEVIQQRFSIQAHKAEKLHYQYEGLKTHSYLQIRGNFIFLTDLWQKGSKVWCKVDKQLVWLHVVNTASNADRLLSDLDVSLRTKGKESVQKQLRIIQEFFWSTWINNSIKHNSDNVQIEFGVLLQDSTGLLDELQSRMYIFALDDFQLLYK